MKTIKQLETEIKEFKIECEKMNWRYGYKYTLDKLEAELKKMRR